MDELPPGVRRFGSGAESPRAAVDDSPDAIDGAEGKPDVVIPGYLVPTSIRFRFT
ncbi:hypothetical protein [Natronococcus jeotgali]|uniref:hypothetical protein n=1 Tax=Natronococcus jeotgali TaxID=413812 RepID=UPI001360B2C3|nr:hypothetical protein [Natronococcus jeotgali]